MQIAADVDARAFLTAWTAASPSQGMRNNLLQNGSQIFEVSRESFLRGS